MAKPRAPITSIHASHVGAENATPDLAAILAATTNLRDGACIGRWDIFDPRNEGESPEAADERHSRAIALCETACPVLAACKTWLDGTPKGQRPAGVVAGIYLPSIDDRRKKKKT